MLSLILEGLKLVGAPVADYFKGRSARTAAKLEADIAISKAKTTSSIHLMTTQQQGDIAWENTSINNAGWKDEWFTIVLSLPAILCFIPGMATVVAEGFGALKETPDWYQWLLLIAVASAFGYRKLADFMSLKKGAKSE